MKCVGIKCNNPQIIVDSMISGNPMMIQNRSYDSFMFKEKETNENVNNNNNTFNLRGSQ